MLKHFLSIFFILFHLPASFLQGQEDDFSRRAIALHLKTIDHPAPQQYPLYLSSNLDWFNTPPLQVERDLREKIVILCFWNYSSIDCIQTIQEFETLQNRFRNKPIVFLGVHSGKNYNDKAVNNVDKAIKRLGIKHRVLNDPQLKIWRKLGASCWPTIVVLGPQGQVINTLCGHGHEKYLETFLETALDHYTHQLNTRPLPQLVCCSPEPFIPSKLAVDPVHNHLYVSDPANHRIVVTTFDGHLLRSIGSGHCGFENGAEVNASFNHPQGLVVHNGKLYIADSHNHAIRVVDLNSKKVSTLAGTGELGCDLKGGACGTEQSLSYPWDLEIVNERLFVSMAGSHQIWTIDIPTKTASSFSGTGEASHRNALLPECASWAQPTGLTMGENTLYVADSESSTVRSISLSEGRTRTIIGGDSRCCDNLFAVGDRDGCRSRAKLQSPFAVLWLEKLQKLLVADSFNHRIKEIDPEEDSVKTIAGTGRNGFADGPANQAAFDEPTGMAAHPDGKKVFIADQNNQKIRLLDLENRTVQTIKLDTLPQAIEPQPEPLVSSKYATKIPATTIARGAGNPGHLLVKLTMPEHHHITEGAPSQWQIRQLAPYPIVLKTENSSGIVPLDGVIKIPYTAIQNGKIHLEAVIYYCKENASCMMEEIEMTFSFIDGQEGSEETVVDYTLPAFNG